MHLTFSPWWDLEGDEIAKSVAEDVSGTKAHDLRRDLFRTYENLYTNREFRRSSGPLGALNAELQSVCGDDMSRVPLNVIKMQTDAVMAQVANIKPKPYFVTEGGNGTIQNKAKLAGRWVNSFFSLRKVYEEGNRAVLDALIFGTGILKVSNDGKRPCVERVHPEEIFVDETETYYNNDPTHIYQRKIISKHLLKKMFPEKERQIEEAGFIVNYNLDEERSFDARTAQIDVIEAWHLESVPGAGDGKHVWIIDGCILLEEEWKSRFLPFEVIRWNRSPRGFFGMGIAENLIGIHVDANVIHTRIKNALQSVGQPMVFIPEGAGIEDDMVTNYDGAIIRYSGKAAPEFVAPTPINPAYLNFSDRLMMLASQSVGNSQAAFDQLVPRGLETGQAVRDFDDVYTKRFKVFAEDIGDMYIGVAERILGEGKKLYDGKKDATVLLEEDKYTVSRVPWDRLSLDIQDEAYYIRVLPVSALSDSPEGKIRQAITLANSGLITFDDARKLMSLPDLEADDDLALAPERNIDRILEMIIDEGKSVAPSPYYDPAKALEKARLALNKAEIDGVPEDRLVKLEEFMEGLTFLVTQARQQQQMEMAQAQMAAQQGAINGQPQ